MHTLEQLQAMDDHELTALVVELMRSQGRPITVDQIFALITRGLGYVFEATPKVETGDNFWLFLSSTTPKQRNIAAILAMQAEPS